MKKRIRFLVALSALAAAAMLPDAAKAYSTCESDCDQEYYDCVTSGVDELFCQAAYDRCLEKCAV